MSEVYKKFTAQDKAVVPFNAHKQYNFNSASAASNKITYYTSSWTSESIDTYTSTSAADTIGAVKYRQLDHLFYKDFLTNHSNRLGDVNYAYQRRTLHEKANILSTPAGLYGHEIKPESFYLTSSAFKIIDDGYGNLVSQSHNATDWVTDIKSNILNIGPVKGFKKYDLNVYQGYIKYNAHQRSPFWKDGETRVNRLTHYTTPNFGDEFDDSYYLNLIKYKKANFSSSTLLAGAGSFPTIDFDGTTEITTGNSELYHFNKKEDFTITFWVKLNGSSPGVTTTTGYLISKSTTKTIVPNETTPIGTPHNTQTTGSFQTLDVPAEPQFPFEVYMNNNIIYFTRSDGNHIAEANSGTIIATNWNHITCRYSSGTLQIFVNGVASSNTGIDSLDTYENTFQNQANVYIGNKGGKSNHIIGNLSQINIYNVALSNTQV